MGEPKRPVQKHQQHQRPVVHDAQSGCHYSSCPSAGVDTAASVEAGVGDHPSLTTLTPGWTFTATPFRDEAILLTQFKLMGPMPCLNVFNNLSVFHFRSRMFSTSWVVFLSSASHMALYAGQVG